MRARDLARYRKLVGVWHRFEKVIGGSPDASIAEPFPAPNDWVQGKGGYDIVLRQLHDLLIEHLS